MNSAEDLRTTINPRSKIDRVLATVIPCHDETAVGIEHLRPIALCGLDAFASDSPFYEVVQIVARDWIVAARDARAHYMFLLGG